MKLTTAVLALSLCIGLGCKCVAGAQLRDVGFQGFTERLWGMQDGLPDQTAQSIVQTPDGSLWIATKIGLLHFDGVRFSVWGRGIEPGVLERGVNCLFVSKDGSLWIGTEGAGVIRFRDGRFQNYPTTDGLTNGFVRAIFEDRKGTIWVGGDQGLFRITGPALTRVDDQNGAPRIFVRSIVEDPQGHIWVGGTELLEFEGTSFVRRLPLPGGPSLNRIDSMYSSPDGTLWVGTLSGLHRLSPSGTLLRLPGIAAEVSVLQQSSDGTLWAGTIGQGLFYYRHSRLFHIAAEKLPSRTVKALLEDREQNVWIGMQAGIIRLSRTPVSILSFPGGADSEFETLYCDPDGSVWVAASEHVFRIQNGVARQYVFQNLRNLRVRTILRDQHGGLWIGTDGKGLLHVTGQHVQQFSSGHGLINDFVRAILQSRDGSIWVGTDGGLTHLRPNGSGYFDTGNGLAYFSVTALAEDQNRDIWVGTSRGLTHISHDRIVHDDVTRAFQQEQIWSIRQDASGVIWFGTSSGLYGLKDNKLVHITTAQGIASNTIYEILDDSRGNIWLGSPNSISRVRLSELDQFQDGSRINLTFYKESLDLESAALYGGMQPEGGVSPNGDVWFASNRGAVRIATNEIVPVSPSSVTIDEISADGQPIAPSEQVLLKPDNRRLEISYAVIHLGSQEGFRYRYRMEGFESWNEVGTRRTAYYTHLPPGKYRFRVQVYEIGNPGVVSEASILVVQKPHFYATVPFLAICIAMLLLAVFLAYRFRLRQMRMRFHAVSEERARLAREMHDTVIQGCVGVSALLEAALEVEPAEEPLREQLLNYATDQVRATIETAREAVWDLRNASTSTANAGALCEELARQVQTDSGIPIRCRIFGDPFKFGESATHEILMIVREAIVNAVTHGAPENIDVKLDFTRLHLNIEVRDDGRGFDKFAIARQNMHYGIVGMQERVQLLNGSIDIESQPGYGTTVCISVPRRQKEHKGIVTGNANQELQKDQSTGRR